MTQCQPIYKRIILKITGEAFSGGERTIKRHAVEKISDEIEALHKLGVQMGIVIGAGNIIRGRDFQDLNDDGTIDYAGMMATVPNILVLQKILEKRNIVVRTQTAIRMEEVAEPYILRKAISHLEKGRIVIFGCGTGNSKSTTDSAAMLRAYELNADALLKGTKVDGLYTDDPKKKSAKFIPEITYQKALESNFKDIMDNAALGLALDNSRKIPIHIFNIFKKGNLLKVLQGKKIGSKIY